MSSGQVLDVRPKWLSRVVRSTGIKYLAFALMFAGIGSAVVYTQAATAAKPITNSATGLCLSGGDTPQVRPCDGGQTQGWDWTQDGTITQNGKCLDIDRQSGGTVTLNDCDGSKFQRWHLNDAMNLVNVSTAACLQPLNAQRGTAPLETTACTQAAIMRWQTGS